MSRSNWRLPGLTAPGTLIRYGHYGRPVLVFPSEQGRAWDYENNGMVEAVADLIEAGRVKLYCVDSYDHVSWSDRSIPLEDRARRHGLYESWILNQVVPAIGADSPGVTDIITTGCSLGRVPRPQLRVQASRPVPDRDLPVRQLRRGQLARLGRARRRDVLQQPGRLPAQPGRRPPGVAAQPGLHACSRSVRATGRPTRPGRCRRLARLPPYWRRKASRTSFDLWGHDVAHDWPWWRQQLAHHLPRFC